ncbi:MAG: hypothetical protein Q9199_001734 [Rusavskia elegans]
MAHGFYVAMGGLAFSIPADLPKSEQFVPSWACGTWFIMRTGLGSLLKMDMDRMPSLSEEEIKSKSKANGLAKTLVCAQALWFLTTCVTRLAQRIPISLLELNTFGHAICALFIYLLWWEKPFEVDIPTKVHSKALLDVYALAWVHTMGQSPLIRSMKSAYRDLLQANEQFQELDKVRKKKLSEKYPKLERDLFTSLDSVAIFEGLPRLFCLSFQRLPVEFPLVQDLVKTRARQPDLNGHPTSTKYMPGENIPGTGIKLRSTVKLEETVRQASGFDPALPSLCLTKQDINRWVMAKRAAELIHALQSSDGDDFRDEAFTRRCTAMPDIFDFVGVLYELPRALALSAAAMVYGGLHALAWFAHFHSPTEQLLWRISSVVIMSGIPTLTAIYKIGRLITSYNWRHDEHVQLSLFWLILLGTIAYILARLYLVIECFIQLSHLPAGVYEVPEWSSYFPHIA